MVMLKTCPIPGEEILYLTFDDGPFQRTTQHAQELTRLNVSATYFWLGSRWDIMKEGKNGGFIDNNDMIMRGGPPTLDKLALVAKDHSVGSCTQSHLDVANEHVFDVDDELEAPRKKIDQVFKLAGKR